MGSSNLAIITGITGQDGAYLSRLLLEKGYSVVGLVRSAYGANLSRLEHLGVKERVVLKECDLTDLSQVIKILGTVRPTEIYNLAAQSSVGLSFQQPIGTIQFNINSVINILETIRMLNLDSRFYQASTSEMFGSIDQLPITEDSKLHPLSPYAISKVAGHHITINYRESYGLYSCCGILFNHESFLRGENFFVKKVIQSALDIKHGVKEFLEVGNLNIKRDFGWSERYVEAMWLMLQQEQPDDYVISTNQTHSVREFLQVTFEHAGLNWEKHVEIDPRYYRPAEVDLLIGDYSKAKQKLGWAPKTRFEDLAKLMVDADIELLERHQRGDIKVSS